MGKHDIEITDAEREDLLAKAGKLAEKFDEIGARVDEENRFPTELVPIYKESGLVHMAVPKKYGGLGADLWTVAQVERELADKGDPAITLAFNMHHVMVGIFRELLDEPARVRLFERVVQDAALISGPFSEERAGFSGLADTVAIPDVHGGWRVTGKKNWATLIEGADIVTFNATVTDEDGSLPENYRQHAAREQVFFIDTDAPGLSVDKTWNTLGMRATGTHTLVMDDVHVPADGYGGNFRNGLIGELEWAIFPFSGVYLGVAHRALRLVGQKLAKKSLGRTLEGEDVRVRDSASVQSDLGKVALQLHIAERAVRGTADLLTEGADAQWNPIERPAQIAVAKVAATEAAVAVTDAALRLLGGGAIRRNQPLERAFRDARAGIYHPLSGEDTNSLLGRGQLGILDEMLQTMSGTEAAAARAA